MHSISIGGNYFRQNIILVIGVSKISYHFFSLIFEAVS